MESVVVLDRSTLAVPLPRPAGVHAWTEHAATAPDEVVPRLREATVVVTNKVVLDAARLAELPRLRLVAVMATGHDNVDVAWCRGHGVAVANVPGYAVTSVSEHVLMLVLALRRSLPGWERSVATGAWQRSPIPFLLDHPVFDLAGAVLALVGYGDIARAVERLARAFGMEVLAAERKGAAAVRPGRVAFGEALARADVVSLHCPLAPETRGLVGAAELWAMKPGAILVNTARGGLVDERALADALRAGRLGGAGVDVLSVEPPHAESPLLDPVLPNLVVTPHVAWTSRRAQETLAAEVARNIESFVRGERRNRVA